MLTLRFGKLLLFLFMLSKKDLVNLNAVKKKNYWWNNNTDSQVKKFAMLIFHEFSLFFIR